MKRIAAWVVLMVITVVAGLCLALTNEQTKDPIKEQQRLSDEKARMSLVPEADTFEALPVDEESGLTSFFAGMKDGAPVGYVAVATVKGFGGAVDVTVGLSTDATIKGISVGGSRFSETAGLGAKSKDPAFTKQFENRTAPLKVIKAGGQKADNTVDAITAATITSTAVTGGVNTAASYAREYLGLNEEEAPATSNTATAYKKGFAGPVAVTITLDENKKISEITIGDDNFAETEGFGAKALEPDFQKQFIGMAPPIELKDIDAISGATYTSTAVVDAINLAYQKVLDAAANQNVAKASKKGFGGPVTVTITLDENKAISDIKIGDDYFAESEGYGQKALEPDFQKQFIGKTPPLALEDIDAISGATVTSTAVVEAINAAYEKLANPEAAAQDAQAAVEAYKEQQSATPTPMPASDVSGNTATASKKGYNGPVAVTLTVSDDGKTIAALTIGDDTFAETAGLGARALEPEFAAQFIGKTLPVALSDIDVLSGATITSTAVVDAVNKAYNKLYPAEEAATPTPVPASDVSGNTATASKKGFNGPVAVTLTVSEDGKTIAALTIGDDTFAETAGFGARALEPEFAAQFVGKTLPVALSDIDIISGATITSQAVIDAVNKAYNKLYPAEEAATPTPVPEDAAVEVTGNTATASKKGYNGPVAVELVVSDDKKVIAGLKIGDDTFAETAGLGARALEPEFAAQFVGKTLPVALSDIDVLSGATITSQAVVDAVNKAYEKISAQ